MLLTGEQKGLEHIWIIADDFAYHTAQQFFNNPRNAEGGSPFYTFNTFEVIEYLSSKYKSSNPSVSGRIINNFVYGLNKHRQLPKLVVIIPDNDIVKGIHSQDDIMVIIGMVTEWIVRECNRAIETYQENLASKCKQPHTPHFLWIAPPTHKNFGKSNNNKREIQTECLEKISRLYNNVSMLKLIKCWSYDDHNAFLYDSYRFTLEGLKKYWSGVDAAIRFCNVVLFQKLITPKKQSKQNKSRFRWQRK